MKAVWIKLWLDDESGAVTVDWTVLAAAIVGLGIASAAAVRSGTTALGTDINTSLSSASVVSMNRLGGTGWEYAPLYSGITMEWMHGPGGYIAQMNAWNATTANMKYYYDSWAAAAQTYIDQGNQQLAALYVDHMYAGEQVLIARGESPNPGSPSVESLHTIVSNM